MSELLQLLREYPPGYGGVERVAHALADYAGGVVFSLRQPDSHERGRGSRGFRDALPVRYERMFLPSVQFGRILIPWPTLRLLRLILSAKPIVCHLPCPTILALTLLMRLLRPGRVVFVYWHAFLAPRAGVFGAFERLYQWLALKLTLHCHVVSTSPVLLDAIATARVSAGSLHLLPCCLLPAQEERLARIAAQRLSFSRSAPPRKVIAIGRLDTYKRIDWLIEAIALVPNVHELHVVGDGPKRDHFEALATRCLLSSQRAYFHGLVSEKQKSDLLGQADLLVLASSQCNEAFGIVQLEAMAAGLPAVALQWPRSGTFWVSNAMTIPGWNGLQHELPGVIHRLFSDIDLYSRACGAAHARYRRIFARALWEQRVDSLLASDG